MQKIESLNKNANLTPVYCREIPWYTFHKKVLPLLLGLFLLGLFYGYNTWHVLGGTSGLNKLLAMVQSVSSQANLYEEISSQLNPEFFPFSFLLTIFLGLILFGVLFLFLLQTLLQSISSSEGIELEYLEEGTEERVRFILLHSLLCLLTQLLFSPWSLSFYLRHLFERFKVGKHRLSFLGGGFLPFVATFFSFMLFFSLFYFFPVIDSSLSLLFLFAILSLSLSLLYSLLSSWFFGNLRCGNMRFKFFTSFSEMWLFFTLQIFLTLLSFGLYLPIALNQHWLYLIRRLEMHDETNPKGRAVGFESDLKSPNNYLSLLSSLLLSVLSLGFYAPWAFLQIQSRWINETCWISLE